MRSNNQKDARCIEWWLTGIAVTLMMPGGMLLFLAMLGAFGSVLDIPWYSYLGMLFAIEIAGVLLLWMAKVTVLLSSISKKLSAGENKDS